VLICLLLGSTVGVMRMGSESRHGLFMGIDNRAICVNRVTYDQQSGFLSELYNSAL